MTEKQCKKCLIVKPFSLFAKNKACRNGIAGICLKCKQIRDKNNPNYEPSHRIADKKYQKRKRLLNPESKRESVKEYHEKHPQKLQARMVVYRAVKTGKLKKGKCRDCERTDTHAHHHDYSKPLEVIWLCPVHHKLEHEKIKGRGLL